MAINRRIRTVVALVAALMIVATVAEAATRRVRVRHQPYRSSSWGYFEFVFEGGMASPTGDQSDDLDFDGPGKGAETGYEVGFRFRQFIAPQLAIAPAFHYVDFGKTTGYGDFYEGDALGYEVQTSLMRYGVDFQFFPSAQSGAPIQPYLTAGLGLLHNRYRDELEFYGPYEASVNTPGVSLGAGFQAGSFEMSGVYTINRFSTDEMTSSGFDRDFNWDYLSLRLGLAFGSR